MRSATGSPSSRIGCMAAAPAAASPAAPAAQTPAPVLVLVRTGPEELPVGGDQLHGTEVVGSQAVLAHQPADAAAEGEARDPGRGDQPAGRRQPLLLGRGVQLAPGEAA